MTPPARRLAGQAPQADSALCLCALELRICVRVPSARVCAYALAAHLRHGPRQPQHVAAHERVEQRQAPAAAPPGARRQRRHQAQRRGRAGRGPRQLGGGAGQRGYGPSELTGWREDGILDCAVPAQGRQALARFAGRVKVPRASSTSAVASCEERQGAARALRTGRYAGRHLSDASAAPCWAAAPPAACSSRGRVLRSERASAASDAASCAARTRPMRAHS
jgi:hypothetical protein